MKYQNVQAFETHLTQSAKLSLSRVFLLVVPCVYERRKLAEQIVRAAGREVEFLARDLGDVKTTLEELNTFSLFSGEKVLYLNGIEKVKKGDLALLTAYVEKPSSSAYLILGSSSSKGLNDLYAKGKKELVALDLSDEKPWERARRLKQVVLARAAQAKKRFSPEAVEHLLELVGPVLPALEQEVDKLVTYTLERADITLVDVQLLCTAQQEPRLWDVVERIVWGNQSGPLQEEIDLGFLLPLISQIRVQLQQGMSVATLKARGVPLQEISPYLPAVKPATLEKLCSPARQRSIGFFRRALDLLFETELMAKNSGFEPAWILDLFLAKFRQLR